MRLTRIAITLLATFGAVPLSAQTAGVATKDAPVVFKSTTNLIPVPVVVRDGKGHAVGNLGIQDFQLYDNGKLQIISKFSVEKLARDPAPKPAAPATAPAASPEPTVSGATLADAKTEGIPDRFVAYLFDDLHLPSPDLVYTRDAAWRQIQASSDPLQRVAIYTTSGVYMQEFTTDKDKLHATLFKIGGGRVAVDRLAELSCPYVSYYMADLIVNKHDKDALAVAIRDAAECGGGKLVPGAAAEALVNGNRDTLGAFSAMRAVVMRMAAMPGQRTIVLVSHGFVVLNDHHDEQTRLIELAIHDNVVISTLDSRGVILNMMIPDASKHGGGTVSAGIIKHAYAEAEASTLAEVMEDIGEGTGGTFYHGSNDYDEGLRLTAATPDYIYVLGFSPPDLKLDGQYHKLKITIKGVNGLELQARKGYYAAKQESDPAEQAKQEMEDALFSHGDVHDLPVTLQTQFLRTGNGDATLTAVAEVDVKKLAFRKEDGNNFNNLKVLTGLFDKDGNYVSGIEKTVQLKFPDEALKNPSGSGVAVKSDFTAHPGRYVVRIVVRDSEGRLMSAQSASVEIP